MKFVDKKKMIVLNGKVYKLKSEKFDKNQIMTEATFDIVDEKIYMNRLKKIAKQLKDKVNTEAILVDTLKEVSLENLDKLERRLAHKPFIRLKTGGCAVLQIGRGNKKQELNIR